LKLIHNKNHKNCFIQLQNRGSEFQNRIFWSDESIVCLQSRENSQNFRTWAFEQPYNFVEVPQFPEQIHIWAAIYSAGVIGPFIFESSVTAATYVQMLNDWFWPKVRNLPDVQQMFFMQDGATPHYALETRQWLDVHFPGRWIGRGGPVMWPPRSPDLTPADFFLWPYLKERVRRRAPINLAELRRVIIEECSMIPVEMCSAACNDVLDRCQKCIGNGGGHF
jgi:hypothetical protein